MSHYSPPRLLKRILRELAARGADVEHLTRDDLAGLDEFHTRGRAATRELAQAAGLSANQRVLDIGSGIGGPARTLAAEFGCDVTGVDLSAVYCEVANELARRTGMADYVRYRVADAVALPFDDASFDAVWTQHAAMNVDDKIAFYRECNRVLRAGGTLALSDVVAGSGDTLLFPTPWADTAAESFVVTPTELQTLLERSGFAIVDWQDRSAQARNRYDASSADSASRPARRPAIHLLLGDAYAAIIANQRRNLDEQRAAVVQVVARKT